MKSFVYILKDLAGKIYIGSTTNITRRMYQHTHHHTATTRKMNEPELVFSQEFESLPAARKIEVRLKKLKRRDFIDKIIADGEIRKMS